MIKEIFESFPLLAIIEARRRNLNIYSLPLSPCGSGGREFGEFFDK